MTAASPSEGATELCRCHTSHSPKDLREMARTGIADLQGNFDQTARGFADELLGAVIRWRVTNCRGDIPVACLNTREK